ncbi:MAG: glycoside hydrolase family 5 protein [Chloroflexota bacterium]|jgi:endoglucanase
MIRLLTHLWMLLAGLFLGVVLASQFQVHVASDQSSVVGLPTSIPVPEGGVAATGCVRDPANLPPPPPGPDGRQPNYYHTCGNRIYDSQGLEVKITGVNWNGMETGDYVPGGLGNRKWQEILDLVASLGYNTLRLPFSNESLEPDRRVNNVDGTLNPDIKGKHPLDVLDLLIMGARERGLKVILDRHKPTPSSYPTLWYTQEVSEERWIQDWRMLAARYKGNDTVIGVDLSNEPRGEATWGSGDPATDWRLAAERAGDAILEENPYLLILVEGIENHQGDHYWWGGNLLGVRDAPVRLKVPNRVVYSPHDYGPNISYQPWFGDPLFPGNLSDVWDRYWGYIHREGIAPLIVGEFGGRSVGDDREGQWQKVLLAYLRKHGIGAMVWSLNPNWDTGGLVAPDWETIEPGKHEAYRQILGAPLGVGPTGIFGQAPTRLKVLYRQEQQDAADSIVAFAFQLVNDGPENSDLSRFELRYWLKANDDATSTPPVSIEAAQPLSGHVDASLIRTTKGDQDHYLRIRFDLEAGYLERYGSSKKVMVRLSTSAWPNHVDAGDYSFAAPLSQPDLLQEWDRVTLYLDGNLVWGREPQ